VASGNLLHYHLGPTRTEQDYLAFIEAQVADLDSDEKVIFMMDQLNTHKSASLVRWVAGQIGYTGPLGKKGKEGILKSQQSRMEFLQRADHDIRFLFTPKHCSWLNPIENWFGRLSKSALKNLSVSSLDGLTQQIKAYIDYYNECLAIPFNWKFDGFQIDRPLKSAI
jgi:transposase